MPTYIGENKIIDRYLGDKFLEAAYIGDKKVYDPYTEIVGYLPIIYKSRAAVALKNYRIHGTAEGAGVETENSFDKDDPSMRMFGYINAQTKVVTTSTSTSLSIIVPVLPNTDYTISKLSTSRFRVGEFSSYPQMGDIATVVHGDRDDPSGIDRGTILSFTTSSSTTYILAFVRNHDDPVTVEEIINSIMVTKGSTAPVTYIPYGYQIPILNTSGVTENLYDIATQIVGEGLGYDGITPESTTSNRSDYISVNSNTAYTLWHNTTDSVSRMIQFLDSSKTFFANTPPTSDTNPMTFTTPKNCAYIRIAYPNTSTEVMLVKGSTAPSEYIPHRYTSNYDLFIGDSKLGEDEYLDYGEQKVWKQFEISGLSEPLCGIGEYKDTLDLSTGTVSRYIKKLVLTGTEDWLMQGSIAKNYYFRLSIGAANTVLNYYALFCTHFVTASIMIATEEIGASVYNSNLLKEATLNIRPSGITAANAFTFKQFLANEYANGTPVTVWYVLVTPTTETVTVPTGLTGVVEGYMSQSGVPTQASPIYPTANGEKQPNDTYSVFTLQPTDPPVPFPPIPTYQGENTLSSTETVGEVTVKGRIKDNMPIVYGWHVDPSISDPANAITYLRDAVGKTPAAMGSETFSYGDWENAFFMPKPCMLRSDGTVAYYLDPNDYTKKADGTASDVANASFDGNAMMEWPLIWYKFEAGTTDGEGYFYCSNKQVDDTYHCWCNYDCDDNIIDHFYTAIYNGTGTDKMRSLSGIQLTPANGNGSTTGQQEVARATANNITSDVEWYTDVYSDRQLISALLILMSKCTDDQAAYGRGLDTGSQTSAESYITGTLNDKGLFYGVTANGDSAVKVFGMENWFGCKWRRTAGLVGGANNKYLYKLTYGTADGSTTKGYNSNGQGYLIANGVLRPVTNNVTKMGAGKHGLLPKETAAVSSSLYYGVYYYNGSGYALFGGNSSAGLNVGSLYVNLSNGLSSSRWFIGASLSCKPAKKKT